ncbi:hypothetical protein [Pseudonocardia endophytica]|uniref:hypothetical protein n=1 Tax=Pseudonocardia endophytica TaxID=401976 RepID=UPI00104D7A35|nr:hypothetical protein [Pseudonocardia endophytica]
MTVGLVAAAPLAWAGGTGYDDATDVKGDKADSSHDKDWGKDKDKGHHAAKVCSFDGGNADAQSLISGGSLVNAVAQAPVAGNNIANLANCSDFLNDNLNGNLSGNQIVIGDNLPPLL